MHFDQTIAKKGKRLNRLAALLFALAGLAERAAGSASPVCLLVLWLIRPTETLARDLVENIAPGAACPPEPVWRRDGATEALRLAQSFRLLAAILAFIVLAWNRDRIAALLFASLRMLARSQEQTAER